MSDAHKHDKKIKKLQQFLQNRRNQLVAQLNESMARGRDLERERDEGVRESLAAASRRGSQKPGNTVWSAKYQEIMDRNTGRKRMATERWNRFAGTEDGGGRGL